jgi:hypothetical protein
MIKFSLEQPSIETLVNEIVAYNHAWKSAKDLLGEDNPLTENARELKACLQVRLLRTYPDQVYLKIDVQESEKAGEEIYSVCLKNPVNNRNNAEHIPVRIIEKLLTKGEIKKYQFNFYYD